MIIKTFFINHVTVSDDEKMDYAQQIIDILDRNTANVHDDELRFYMNEMVIFSLKEAMKRRQQSRETCRIRRHF